jgi:hypothetical protein
MPVTVAAAVEEELSRGGHAAVERRGTQFGRKTNSTGAADAALAEVAMAFGNRDKDAFLEAIRKLTSLPETAGDGTVGAKMVGEGLAKTLGPLLSEDGARTFLQEVLPADVQREATVLTSGVKDRLAEKSVKDEKRAKQQEKLKDHLERRRNGTLDAAEEYIGPDLQAYTILQMHSGHDGWEKQGVKTEFVFPGYGFGSHQALIQYNELGQGYHQKEVEMDMRGENIKKWAETFVGNSMDVESIED